MLSFEEARAKILTLAHIVTSEVVSLEDAVGRVLAKDLRATSDIPAFDSSTMDGYAIAAKDVVGDGPWTLPVRGESRTGRPPTALEPKSASRIFTGASLPDGADAILMQEDATRTGDQVSFSTRPRATFVRRRGSDLANGAVALPAGTRIGAAQIALAAMLDQAALTVARKPIVTVVATGDELRAPGAPAAAGSVAESNGVALRAMANAVGADTRIAPYVKDDADETARALRDAVTGSDLVVTVGGVSVGDHDHVRPALEAIGVSLEFWRVAIKPGKPLAVGTLGSTVVLALPGNPASAFVTFALFGLPLLRAMQGETRTTPLPLRVTLRHDVAHDAGRLEFARAALTLDREKFLATVHPNQASGALTSLASADALVLLPLDADSLPAGAEVDAYTMRDLLGAAR